MIKEHPALSSDELEIDLAEELQRDWNYYISKGEHIHSVFLSEDNKDWLADIVREKDGSTIVRAATGEARTCANYKAALTFCRVLTIEAEHYANLN